MLLAVRISSYGCTWEVWRALKKLELLSAAPRATLTLLSCTSNFPHASITRYTHAKHEPNLKCLPILKSIMVIMKHFKSLNGLGDAVSKLKTFVWILSHISRSITWSLFTLKASYLIKLSISAWSFMWWCQFVNWLKFETRPSSLLNFRTAYCFKSIYSSSIQYVLGERVWFCNVIPDLYHETVTQQTLH